MKKEARKHEQTTDHLEAIGTGVRDFARIISAKKRTSCWPDTCLAVVGPGFCQQDDHTSDLKGLLFALALQEVTGKKPR